jgi:hypothetical protein
MKVIGVCERLILYGLLSWLFSRMTKENEGKQIPQLILLWGEIVIACRQSTLQEAAITQGQDRAQGPTKSTSVILCPWI